MMTEPRDSPVLWGNFSFVFLEQGDIFPTFTFLDKIILGGMGILPMTFLGGIVILTMILQLQDPPYHISGAATLISPQASRFHLVRSSSFSLLHPSFGAQASASIFQILQSCQILFLFLFSLLSA